MTEAVSKLWSYLLVYSNDLGTTDQVRAVIDNNVDIVNWYKCLPNAFFITSPQTASTLAREIRGQLGDKRFIILDTQTDRSGWLPTKAWDFMKNPRAIDK
jgi:hypothetical protein